MADRGGIREHSHNSRHAQPQVPTVLNVKAAPEIRSVRSGFHQSLKNFLGKLATAVTGASPFGSPVQNPLAVPRLLPRVPKKLQSGLQTYERFLLRHSIDRSRMLVPLESQRAFLVHEVVPWTTPRP